MNIIYTAEFIRLFKKLPIEVKREAVKKEKIFKKNPFGKGLKIYKLNGKLKGCWSFSISYSYRIICEFDSNEIVYFHSIGNHDIYN